MITINTVNNICLNPIAFKNQYQTSPYVTESKGNKVTEKYLDNLALINAPAVKKVESKQN